MDTKRMNNSPSGHSSLCSSFPVSSTGLSSWRQSLDKGLKRLRQSLPRLTIYYTDDDLRKWNERCRLYNLRTYGNGEDEDDITGRSNFEASVSHSAIAVSAPPTYESQSGEQRFTFNEPLLQATVTKGPCLTKPSKRPRPTKTFVPVDGDSARSPDFGNVSDPTESAPITYKPELMETRFTSSDSTSLDVGVERRFYTRTKTLKSALPKFNLGILQGQAELQHQLSSASPLPESAPPCPRSRHKCVRLVLSSIWETKDDEPTDREQRLSSTETAFFSFRDGAESTEYILTSEEAIVTTPGTESVPSPSLSVMREEDEEDLTEQSYYPTHLPKTGAFFKQTFKISVGTDRCFPHFSVWVSLVQIVVFAAALFLFGWCPFGPSGQTRMLGRVLTPNLVVDHVCRVEYRSYFLALRQSDLIRLGARYAPCMRPDETIQQDVIERQKVFDRSSGCCMRNDESGCYQTLRERCSHLLSTWLRYETGAPSTALSNSQLSELVSDPATTLMNTIARAGPVCGLDPNYCLNPHPSQTPAWNSGDVTTWPVCHLSLNQSSSTISAPHMRCEVTGRPCCVGIRGECIITTREHCEFLQGIYNPKASLCSQVNCLEQSCGLWSFVYPTIPDQFYRPILSLFIHENLPVLLLSVLVQLVFVRIFEQFLGWWRIAVIFLCSSLFGSIISVWTQPYQVGTGPTHTGVLLAQLVDFYYYREWVEDEYPGILYISLPIIFLFLLGFLPSLDNIANMGSALAGILLYHVITTDIRQSVRVRVICGLTYVCLLFLAYLLFYLVPVQNCDWCNYLTCVPLLPGMCYDSSPGWDARFDCVPLNW